MRALTLSDTEHRADKAFICQQAHVLRTRHWVGNNLWSPHPVLEAQLLDVPEALWQELESLLLALLQGVALPARMCQVLPALNGRGTVVIEAAEPPLGRSVLQQALELLALAPLERAQQWSSALGRIRHVMDDECLGPSTACIAQAAQARQLPAYRLFPKGNLVQLGMGRAQQRIWTAESDLTGAIAQDIAADKALTKRLLANAGIPTPQGDVANSPAQAWLLAQRLGVPVVVKPLDGNRARGVSLDLMDQASVEVAWLLAKREGTQVLVERCIPGYEHRVLVVGHQVVAATRGQTLSVVGDGVSAMAQLVEAQINQHPRCLIDNTLERIELASNRKIQIELQRQQLDMHSVPFAGQQVVLLRTGNLTVDCTDEVHPDVAQHAVMAARTVGLDIAGIDMVLQDIRLPLLAQGGAIVEVNAGPSLLMHLYPVQGQARAVGQSICSHLFPHPDDGRIPVTGVLASADAGQRLAPALAAWQQAQGLYTGVACGDAMYVQDQHMPAPATAAPSAGQRVLMHCAVGAAVIAQDMDVAWHAGWPYAQCDAAIICPQDSTLDAHTQQRILATQLRTVRPGGVAVLSTGCHQLESLALTCLGQVVWVDADEQHPLLQAHRRVNGCIAFVRQGRAVCAQGLDEVELPLPHPASGWILHEWLALVATGWVLQWPLPVLEVMAQQTVPSRMA
jgi:cyanophycin synthetase